MNSVVLERLLSRYGQVVTVTGADGIPQEGRAFVQPICETGETALQVCPTPLGTRRGDQYRYLGSPNLPLAAGDSVSALGLSFRVQTAQPIRVGETLSHWWAVLRVRGEEQP